MLRVAGIVALIVLATACGSTPVTTVASPSPVIAQGVWTEGLTFTGDVPGQVTGIISAAAFSFIVQEPSGIIPRLRAISLSSSDFI